MPNWKKVITSGSNAHLNHITASGNISSSGQLIAASADFNDGNITNVGQISVDSVLADGDSNVDIALSTNGINFDVNNGDQFVFNGNENTADLDYKDSLGDSIFHIDESLKSTTIGVQEETAKSTLHVTGDITVKSNGHITASGNIKLGGDISASGDLLKTKFVQMTNSSSVIDTFNTGSFRSAKYVLQVTSGSNYQVSEMLVLHHDNLTASNTEYAQLNSGLNLVDFTTSVSGANVKLSAAGSFLSCSVRFDRTIIPI